MFFTRNRPSEKNKAFEGRADQRGIGAGPARLSPQANGMG